MLYIPKPLFLDSKHVTFFKPLSYESFILSQMVRIFNVTGIICITSAYVRGTAQSAAPPRLIRGHCTWTAK